MIRRCHAHELDDDQPHPHPPHTEQRGTTRATWSASLYKRPVPHASGRDRHYSSLGRLRFAFKNIGFEGLQSRLRPHQPGVSSSSLRRSGVEMGECKQSYLSSSHINCCNSTAANIMAQIMPCVSIERSSLLKFELGALLRDGNSKREPALGK